MEGDIDVEMRGSILHALGNAFVRKSDYDAAMRYYKDALDAKFVARHESVSILKIYRNMAMIQVKNDKSLALSNMSKAIRIAESIYVDELLLARLYIDKATFLFTENDDDDDAWHYIDRATEILNSSRYPEEDNDVTALKKFVKHYDGKRNKSSDMPTLKSNGTDTRSTRSSSEKV